MNKYNFIIDKVNYKDHTIENFFEQFTQQKEIIQYVKDNLMLLCVGGSHAYGLDTETSDLDIRGIFKDNIDMILGMEKIESLENSTNDAVIYALTKALHLIIEQNPNMQELLWVDEEEILYASDDYWYVRSRRDELLSTLTRHKYSGYAISQLKRMKGHNKWLNKEQEGKFKKKPNIKDYIIHIHGIDGSVNKISTMTQDMSHFYFTKVKDEIYNMWYNRYHTYPLIEDGNSFIPIQESDGMKDIDYWGVIWFNKSQFQIDLDEYNKWKTWKDNRNEKRHELEEKFGYDTKHAMHTMRLLNMGVEILDGEGVKVKRPDKDMLLNIRNGNWSYELLIKHAERVDQVVLENCYKNSKLPKSVNKKIYIEIIRRY